LLERELQTMRQPRDKMTWVPVAGVDRMLAFLPEGPKGEPDNGKTFQTRKAIAEAAAAFIKGEDLSGWVEAAHAEFRMAGKSPSDRQRTPGDADQKKPTPAKKPAARKKKEPAPARKTKTAAKKAKAEERPKSIEELARSTRTLAKGDRPLTMVYLAGRHEVRMEDPYLFRVTSQLLEAEGIAGKASAVNWLDRWDELRAAIAAAEDNSIVLSGDLEGGEMAYRLAEELPQKVRAMVLHNPSIPADREAKVPTLVVRGEHDRGPRPDDARLVDRELRTMRRPRDKVTLIPVAGADRILRYWPAGPKGKIDWDGTEQMRKAVVQAVAAFLEGEALPGWVDAAHADLGLAGKSPSKGKRTPAKTQTAPSKPASTAAFEKLGNGDYRSTVASLGEEKDKEAVTVLHLHGAGKPTGYELFDRLIDGLKNSGKLAGKAISVPWENPRAEAKLTEAVKKAADQSLVITGHAAACHLIYRLARQYPSKFRAAVVLNPRVDARQVIPVPTLFVRGEHSTAVDTEVEALVMRDGSPHTVVYYPVPNADHSLRRRTRGTMGSLSREAKLRLARSPKTVALNREIGRAIASFIVDRKLPGQVSKARAPVKHARQARALSEKIRELPQAVRSRVDEQLFELMAKDPAHRDEPLEAIAEEQRDAGQQAVRKVLKQRNKEPSAHPEPPEIRWLRPTKGSKRKVQVVRYSQPDHDDLYYEIVWPAEKKGIKPSEIAVINLRLENNREARWPREYPEYKGLKMIDAGYLDHSVPPLQLVKKVLKTMLDPKLKLVVLHCYAGKARTGTMTAAMRIVLDGWTGARALKEAKDHGMTRPLQHYFIKWFARQVKSGKFNL
jgi:pimeloyl-ACP methyl ester carboxylesterase